MSYNSENQKCETPCTTILPGGTDLCVDRNDCKVRADITLDRVRSVIIWGTVKDCTGMVIPNALVKLLRYTGECGCELKEICRTHTDCQGYYQFDLEQGCEGRYRVLVSSCASINKEEPCEKCKKEKPCPPPCDTFLDKQYNGKPGSCRSTSRNNVQYY